MNTRRSTNLILQLAMVNLKGDGENGEASQLLGMVRCTLVQPTSIEGLMRINHSEPFKAAKIMGTKLKFATTYHPYASGQVERISRSLDSKNKWITKEEVQRIDPYILE